MPSQSLKFAAFLALGLAACRSIGPASVPRDRIDYLGSLGTSWKQQTLLNIVKLRYGDVPIFLEVTQVIAGYQLQTTVAAGVAAGKASPRTVGPLLVGGTAGGGATHHHPTARSSFPLSLAAI